MQSGGPERRGCARMGVETGNQLRFFGLHKQKETSRQRQRGNCIELRFHLSQPYAPAICASHLRQFEFSSHHSGRKYIPCFATRDRCTAARLKQRTLEWTCGLGGHSNPDPDRTVSLGIRTGNGQPDQVLVSVASEYPASRCTKCPCCM